MPRTCRPVAFGGVLNAFERCVTVILRLRNTSHWHAGVWLSSDAPSRSPSPPLPGPEPLPLQRASSPRRGGAEPDKRTAPGIATAGGGSQWSGLRNRLADRPQGRPSRWGEAPPGDSGAVTGRDSRRAAYPPPTSTHAVLPSSLRRPRRRARETCAGAVWVWGRV